MKILGIATMACMQCGGKEGAHRNVVSVEKKVLIWCDGCLEEAKRNHDHTAEPTDRITPTPTPPEKITARHE